MLLRSDRRASANTPPLHRRNPALSPKLPRPRFSPTGAADPGRSGGLFLGAASLTVRLPLEVKRGYRQRAFSFFNFELNP